MPNYDSIKFPTVFYTFHTPANFDRSQDAKYYDRYYFLILPSRRRPRASLVPFFVAGRPSEDVIDVITRRQAGADR